VLQALLVTKDPQEMTVEMATKAPVFLVLLVTMVSPVPQVLKVRPEIKVLKVLKVRLVFLVWIVQGLKVRLVIKGPLALQGRMESHIMGQWVRQALKVLEDLKEKKDLKAKKALKAKLDHKEPPGIAEAKDQ